MCSCIVCQVMHHIGILGAGGISDTHARAAAALPNVRVSAVCGSNAAKVEALANRYGAAAFTDVAAFLAHKPMDIVAIGSPSGLHADQGVMAAAAGLHLYVEKPLDVTIAKADALIAAAERAGVKIAVCFQDRNNPRLSTVKQWIDGGVIGEPRLVSARVKWYRPPEYYAQSKWRGTRSLDGGGALMNQGIHTVDLLLWWLGDIVRVSARSGTLVHKVEVEDTIVGWLEFANGAIGTLEATTAAYPGYPRRVEVTGTRGTVSIEQDRIVGCDVRDAPPEVAAAMATQDGDQNAQAASAIVSDARGHQRILEDLLDAIETGRPPRCDGHEGRRSVAVVEALYESAATGRPVDVSRK
jgi:UDP-N-acetyl-2-amino-2-deoxyglucuronate dehydrogenase